MNTRLLGLIMRFCIELIPDSTVYTISDRIGFKPLSDENGLRRLGSVRSRVNKRPTRYEIKTVSCKQGPKSLGRR